MYFPRSGSHQEPIQRSLIVVVRVSLHPPVKNTTQTFADYISESGLKVDKEQMVFPYRFLPIPQIPHYSIGTRGPFGRSFVPFRATARRYSKILSAVQGGPYRL